ncbi:hypothetical protein GCM10022225_35780 [Plantactinospora mayteni]|uniref:LPXTG cell wall anchor domain-containing protein n=1 Tax=Plantactinospora mayteni TaxID=566021 RepID=A0ABQ4EMD6_9ACTN|nr:hypothetical protein [Plantactinospora mayteni]GIG95811.1 hypothetical protein Pma05_23840 [Plantactinospora mayteni]
MSRKLLGKVMAGAGLGAVSLLICAPGAALADDALQKPENKGHISTVPKGVKPGHKFKLILECEHPVEKAWVESKITGKISLALLAEDGVLVPNAPLGNGGRPDDGAPAPAPSNGEVPPLPPEGELPLFPRNGEQPPSSEGTQPDEDDAQADDGQGEPAASGEAAKYWAWATVPEKTKPGNYRATGACNGTGTIVVPPQGSVPGGDGGVVGTDAGRTAAGAGLLGAAVIGGFLMIRRRRTDGSPA